MIDRRQVLLRLAGLIAAWCFPIGCRLDKEDALREYSSLDNLAMAGPPDYSLDAWNDFFQGLVIARGYDPPYASRVYAYLTLAQACAITKMSAQIAADSASEPTKRMAAIRGSAATAAFEVLRPFFPAALASPQRYQEAISSYMKQAGLPAVDHSRAVYIGTSTSQLVIKRLMADGADDLRHLRIPEGASVWRTEENRPPVRPYWGHVTPSIVNVSLFQQKPPPSVNSAAFKEAMHEVSTRAKNVTAEERRIVDAWADAAGSSTPAGHWNRIACDLGRKYHREETHALEATTLMNLSLFDAGILCWREKYTYWLARPNQVDRELRPLLKVPNFPAYPSGHSAFSGAAARVLAYFYPEALSELEAMARQASESRIIAGIHYRFDCEEGLRIGRWAAKSAINAWQTRKRFIDTQWC